MPCELCSAADCDGGCEAKRNRQESIAKARTFIGQGRPPSRNNLKPADLDKIYSKLTNALKRDADWLLDASMHGPLKKEEATALANYLKLMKDLRKVEQAQSADLSEEQLEKIVGKGAK